MKINYESLKQRSQVRAAQLRAVEEELRNLKSFAETAVEVANYFRKLDQMFINLDAEARTAIPAFDLVREVAYAVHTGLVPVASAFDSTGRERKVSIHSLLKELQK